jgi:hypothetical protein
MGFYPFVINFLLLYVLKLFTKPFFYLCVKCKCRCKCNRERVRERERERQRKRSVDDEIPST